MKNKWRILKIFVTVILLGFLLSFSLKRFSNKKMTDEDITIKLKETETPVYFIDEKDLKKLVAKTNPEEKVGGLMISDIEKKVNNIPYIDSADVYLNLNGNLYMDIKQRVPVFRLNYKNKDFYVDKKGVEFPTSRNYSFPCMLVTGKIKQEEYPQIIELVEKINEDPFSKNFFIGIEKENKNYQLLTSNGNYKVELGDLDNINFKIKGFKTFVEKYLIRQNPEKYSKISLKYDNQIVTTLKPGIKSNDSIIALERKELSEAPSIKKTMALEKASEKNKAAITEKPKEKTVVKVAEKTTKKPTEKVVQKPVTKVEKKPVAKVSNKPKEKPKEKDNKTKNKTH